MGYPSSGVFAPLGVLTTVQGKIKTIDDQRIDENRLKVRLSKDDAPGTFRLTSGWIRQADGTAFYIDMTKYGRPSYTYTPIHDGVPGTPVVVPDNFRDWDRITNEEGPSGTAKGFKGVVHLKLFMWHGHPDWFGYQGWVYAYTDPDEDWPAAPDERAASLVKLAILTVDLGPGWLGGEDNGGPTAGCPILNIDDARIPFGA